MKTPRFQIGDRVRTRSSVTGDGIVIRIDPPSKMNGPNESLTIARLDGGITEKFASRGTTLVARAHYAPPGAKIAVLTDQRIAALEDARMSYSPADRRRQLIEEMLAEASSAVEV